MTAITTAPDRTAAAARSRILLGALVLSSPLWAAVSLAQVATRDGFNLTRHPLSMLSTGSLGWIQITNFVVAGVLAVAGARGLARVVPGRWVPCLVMTYGVGYVLSGVFTLDAGGGFPAGATDTPATLSWHAGLHLAVGIVAFIALTAALVILGRQLNRRGEHGWAVGSFVAAAGVVIADLAATLAIGPSSLVLAVGVLAAMFWLSAIAAKLRREL